VRKGFRGSLTASSAKKLLRKNRALFGIKLARMLGVFCPVVSVQSKIFDGGCAYVIRRKYEKAPFVQHLQMACLHE